VIIAVYYIGAMEEGEKKHAVQIIYCVESVQKGECLPCGSGGKKNKFILKFILTQLSPAQANTGLSVPLMDLCYQHSQKTHHQQLKVNHWKNHPLLEALLVQSKDHIRERS